VVCRRCKLRGRRFRIAREVPAALVSRGVACSLGLRPALENGELGDSTEACIIPQVGLFSVCHDDGDGLNAKEATSVEGLTTFHHICVAVHGGLWRLTAVSVIRKPLRFGP
jgi:hypothetical protein